MAAFAVLSEFPLVRVVMAGVTAGEFQPGELLEFFPVARSHRVAFHTRLLRVHPVQLEFCIGMIEQGSRLECVVVVAGCAILGKCFLVVVRVTGNAGGIQAQVGCLFLFNDRT